MDLEAGLGEALRNDYLLLREEFTPAQLDYLERTRRFVHTFEGTATIQNLIVGRDITGVSAFTTGA